jgi:hypothetical protein
MGLSLLLKIFEEWEKKQIIIEVKDLNRMVNMLFKITGLGRFIQGGNDITKTGEKNTINPQAPIHANANKSAEGLNKKSHIKKKLNFVASLQTGQQLTGWYLFNTYLQRRMQKAIHFDQSQDVLNESSIDILFAKPFEACSMIKRRGFVPIMRPIAEADEVIILTRADDERELGSVLIADSPLVFSSLLLLVHITVKNHGQHFKLSLFNRAPALKLYIF